MLRAVRTLAAAVAVIVLLTGCAPEPESPAVTFAVAGDSLTAWDNDSFPEPDGEFADITWLHWAISPALQLAGGYARQGAFASQIADEMPIVDADVLVVMAGSNDIGVTEPAQILAAIEAIAAATGIESVVLCAIPPQTGFTSEAEDLNYRLVELAAERGWVFVDPWGGARDADGEWIDEMTFDGIHPTAPAAKEVGADISAAVLKAAG